MDHYLLRAVALLPVRAAVFFTVLLFFAVLLFFTVVFLATGFFVAVFFAVAFFLLPTGVTTRFECFT